LETWHLRSDGKSGSRSETALRREWNDVNGFYRMPKNDGLVLVVILAITVLLFFPWSRATKIGGIVAFGWGMGLLMFIAPVLGLLALFATGSSKHEGDNARTGGARS